MIIVIAIILLVKIVILPVLTSMTAEALDSRIAVPEVLPVPGPFCWLRMASSSTWPLPGHQAVRL